MSTLINSRLPKGSTILITGVTGYIGSHIADQAISLGYKVRGGVRSIERASWLQSLFDKKYGPGSFTTITLVDALDVSAVEAAVKNVDGIIDVAVDSQLSPEPEPYIPNTIKRTLNLLEAAANNTSVKSVVVTSSSMAAIPWEVNKENRPASTSYNEGFIKLAWDSSFTDPGKMFVVYGAAKAQQEQAAWKFVSESKPSFVLNTVLPAANFGPALSPENQGLPSTGGWPKALFEGDLSLISNVPPQHFIDVRDTARIHVAALVSSTAVNERFWAFAEPYNWNQILGIFRKLYPTRTFINNIEGVGKDLTIPPNESAKALLHYFGQENWTGLEGSLKESLESIGLDK